MCIITNAPHARFKQRSMFSKDVGCMIGVHWWDCKNLVKRTDPKMNIKLMIKFLSRMPFYYYMRICSVFNERSLQSGVSRETGKLEELCRVDTSGSGRPVWKSILSATLSQWRSRRDWVMCSRRPSPCVILTAALGTDCRRSLRSTEISPMSISALP